MRRVQCRHKYVRSVRKNHSARQLAPSPIGPFNSHHAEAALFCAQSRAKVDARKNFLLAYFLYTYTDSKSSSTNRSHSSIAPDTSCDSVVFE